MILSCAKRRQQRQATLTYFFCLLITVMAPSPLWPHAQRSLITSYLMGSLRQFPHTHSYSAYCKYSQIWEANEEMMNLSKGEHSICISTCFHCFLPYWIILS